MRGPGRRLGVLTVGLLLVLTSYRADSQTPAVDPPSLLGSWVGTWTETGRRGLTGPYFLTLERVEGDRLFGTGELRGRRVTVPPFTVSATLSGNRLTYGTRVRTELTVDGDRMTGNTTGANDDVAITLKKEKY
jgi:hypothetical protein